MAYLDLEKPQEIYSVSRLNREVREFLEENFTLVWIEGEISNFSAPSSGHWYFSLKDTSAQVRCAMFRMRNTKLRFTPQDGMHVTLRARISLYEGRGDFQLLVEDMEDRGEGRLRRAFELLKQQLEAKGLFDLRYKKPLPKLPNCVGVITSPTGAAIKDILTVLKRRFPCVPIIIYPTLVQGNTAAATIVKAIETANRRQECDVLILARGGGSLEDLWPFNEEIVAHSIHQSLIPIISGVGHEIDFTIADFVADHRAATPSAAAELVAPDKSELSLTLYQTEKRLVRCLTHKLSQSKQQIDWSLRHLSQQHPKRQLLEKMQRLDVANISLTRLQQRLFSRLQAELNTLSAKLKGLTPLHRIIHCEQQLTAKQQLLQKRLQTLLQQRQLQLTSLAAKLDGLSPLATLSRGYAIAVRADTQEVLRNADEVAVGEKVQIKLMKGSLDCSVVSRAR